MAGWVAGIRRALVLGLVLIAGTAIEQVPSIGPKQIGVNSSIQDRRQVDQGFYGVESVVCDNADSLLN